MWITVCVCVCMSTSVGVSPTCCVRLGCPFVWCEKTGDRKSKKERYYWSSRGLTKKHVYDSALSSLSVSLYFFSSPLFWETNRKTNPFFFLCSITTEVYTLIMFQKFKTLSFSPFSCCMQMLSNVYVCVNDLALVVTEEEIIWNPSRGMYQQVILPSHFFKIMILFYRTSLSFTLSLCIIKTLLVLDCTQPIKSFDESNLAAYTCYITITAVIYLYNL